MSGLSNEARVLLYTRMYTAVSKATAETTNAKGESVKTTYNGTLADLFDGVCNHRRTVTAFMWAITHKTDALPTQLFRAVDHGAKGYEIFRVHSGFYDNQRNHIVGTALIPFIMDAMKLWEPKKRVSKQMEFDTSPSDEERVKMLAGKIVTFGKDLEATSVFNLQKMSDDELTNLQFEIKKEFDRRAEYREKQVKLAQVLELAEMSKEELMDLLGAV